MKLYKKQVKIELIFNGGQGFCDDIRVLCDWTDEDDNTENKIAAYKKQYKDSYGNVGVVIRYVPIDRK